MKQSLKIRLVLGVIAMAGLLLIYVMQRVDVAHWFGVTSTFNRFVINRTVRFVLNDLLVILLIYAIFCDKKYVTFALGVQIASLFLVLLPYFVIKYHYPAYNGPLLSFLHRLVLNPLLMLMLIPAFYLQQSAKSAG